MGAGQVGWGLGALASVEKLVPSLLSPGSWRERALLRAGEELSGAGQVGSLQRAVPQHQSEGSAHTAGQLGGTQGPGASPGGAASAAPRVLTAQLAAGASSKALQAGLKNWALGLSRSGKRQGGWASRQDPGIWRRWSKGWMKCEIGGSSGRCRALTAEL